MSEISLALIVSILPWLALASSLQAEVCPLPRSVANHQLTFFYTRLSRINRENPFCSIMFVRPLP
jgi:hypothetical protein